jgi:hypothetical protein
MTRKKRRKKPAIRNLKTVKITPASIVGVGIGLLLMFTGAYSALEKGEYGGYYVVALGAVFAAAVGWGAIRNR